MDKLNALVGCPICQKTNILQEFLMSLANTNREGFNLDFLFIDDNTSQESVNLLKSFVLDGSNVNTAGGKIRMIIYARKVPICGRITWCGRLLVLKMPS